MTIKPERRRLSFYMGCALLTLLLSGGKSEPVPFLIVLTAGLIVCGVIKALENLSDQLQIQRIAREMKAKK